MGDRTSGTQPDFWPEALDLIANSSHWSSKELRSELRRIRELIGAGKSPRDSETVERTIRKLEGRQDIVADNAKRESDNPELWTTLLSVSSAVLATTLTDEHLFPIGRWSALLLLGCAVLAAVSIYSLRQIRISAKSRKDAESTASEFTTVVSMMRQRIDDTKKYAQLPDGTYVAELGTDEDLEKIHDLRDNVRLNLGVFGGGEQPFQHRC